MEELRLTLVMVSHGSTVVGRAQRTGLMENGQLTVGTRPSYPMP
jgi:predicted ABC-type transport system involved in lysophospholipase L1 biosynthesis ATPase subunit